MSKIKKKHVVNTGILIILSAFCLGPLIASFLDSSISTTPEQPTSLRTSTTFWANSIDLDNGFWLARNIGGLSIGDYFYYEYDTSPYAELDVYLLDSSNYALYAASQSYTAYSILETNEDYVWSEGPVYVYKSDTFWVVYENTYSDTYLDYSITTYVTSPYIPNLFGGFFFTMIVIIVVSVVIGIVVIAVIIVAIRKNTRTVSTTTPYRSSSNQAQRTPTPSTPVYQQPTASSSSKSEPTKGTIGFCRYCGDKTEVDATFCPRCGSKL